MKRILGLLFIISLMISAGCTGPKRPGPGPKPTEKEPVETARTAAESFVEGRRFFEEGLYDKALEKFDTAVKDDPKFYLTYGHRGDIYMYQRNYDKALEDYKKGRDLKPDDYSFYVKIGDASSMLGNYEEAEKNFDKAIEMDPKRFTAYHKKGLMYAGQKKYEQAMEMFAKTVEVDPKEPYGYYAMANVLIETGDYQEAVRRADEGLKDNPNDLELLSIKAKAYSNFERGEANKIYGKIIERGPNDPEIYYEALRYSPAGSKEREKIFQTAIKKFPDYAKYYNYMGKEYFISHDFESARDLIKKAAELDPDNYLVLKNLGFMNYYDKKMDEADKNYQKSYELLAGPFKKLAENMDKAEMDLEYSSFLASMGKTDEAAEMCLKARETIAQAGKLIKKTNWRLAYIYARAGKYDLADQAVKEAEKVDNNPGQKTLSEAFVDASKGNLPAAMEKVNKANQQTKFKGDYLFKKIQESVKAKNKEDAMHYIEFAMVLY